jgi:hypothetical protein
MASTAANAIDAAAISRPPTTIRRSWAQRSTTIPMPIIRKAVTKLVVVASVPITAGPAASSVARKVGNRKNAENENPKQAWQASTSA